VFRRPIRPNWSAYTFGSDSWTNNCYTSLPFAARAIAREGWLISPKMLALGRRIHSERFHPVGADSGSRH
jgi:hypothetical protein